jgi:hypothetical protein
MLLPARVTAKFGANCLMARRLVERGVRLLPLKMCKTSDKPSPAL